MDGLATVPRFFSSSVVTGNVCAPFTASVMPDVSSSKGVRGTPFGAELRKELTDERDRVADGSVFQSITCPCEEGIFVTTNKCW